MKKVVCAACGLVNLDKFVSFPHCAACGARLPQQAPSQWRSLWRRPVRPIYWMLAIGSGLALLGWAIASIAREGREGGDKPLLVYSQVPRAVAPGQTATAQFTLDSAQENPDSDFKAVSLRLSRETRRDFVIANVQPAPTKRETRGSGIYYLWDELPRNGAIRLALKPRAASNAAGVLQLRATLGARGYQMFEVRASIETAAKIAPMQTAPNVAR